MPRGCLSLPRRQRLNPLDEMVARMTEGPLTLLKRAYAARARVQVVTRHTTGVRGVATGEAAAAVGEAEAEGHTSGRQTLKQEHRPPACAERPPARSLHTGTLVAFDRYCNLVLREVDETYTVLLKVQRGGRQCRAQEQRQRHLKQVFVKGQGVVMVSVASEKAAPAGGDGRGAAQRPAGPGRGQRPPAG